MEVKIITLEKCAFDNSAFTSLNSRFADLFKHLFVTCGQCCVASLNKRACDALMFSICVGAALFWCQIDVMIDAGLKSGFQSSKALITSFFKKTCFNFKKLPFMIISSTSV